MFIIGMRYDGFDDQLEVLRHTSALVFQLESVSSVCGRTTYFPLGQSRQNRPGASQNFHVTKAGPRTPWLHPAIVWIGAFPGGHSPSRIPPYPTSRHIPLPSSAEGGGPLAKGEWCRINSPAEPPSRSFEQLFAHKHTQKGACTSAHSPSSVYIPNYTVSSCFSPSTSACSFSSG